MASPRPLRWTIAPATPKRRQSLVSTASRSSPTPSWTGTPSFRAQSRYGSIMYLPAGTAASAMWFSRLASERLARAGLLLAGLVVTALERERGLALLLLCPIAERIAPPRLLQAERRQLQVAPHLQRPVHIRP